MRLSRTAPFPVRGIPLMLFALSLFGITVATYLDRLILIPWETIFVFLFILSQGSGVEIRDADIVLLYGFGVLKQRLPLESIDELSVLSRLEYGTILGHFKAYALSWLAIVLWLLFDFFVLKGTGNPIRLYMDIFVIMSSLLFFLSLSVPRNRRGTLKWVVVAFSIIMFTYPYRNWGSKALLPAFLFVLLAILILRAFQKSDFIILTAQGKSYLLSSENSGDALERIREVMGDAQAP